MHRRRGGRAPWYTTAVVARTRTAPRRDEFPRPAVAADALVYSIADDALRALVIRRRNPPHEGRWAIPGGFVEVGDAYVDQGEDVDVSAARELEEEAGIRVGAVDLHQFRTYGKPNRDPRTRVITVVYHGFATPEVVATTRAGDDAAEAEWVPVARLLRRPLAFDHSAVLRESLVELRQRMWDTPVVAPLLPRRFRATELRRVLGIVEGSAIDPGRFRTRFRRMVADGVVAPSGTGTGAARRHRFTRPRS